MLTPRHYWVRRGMKRSFVSSAGYLRESLLARLAGLFLCLSLCLPAQAWSVSWLSIVNEEECDDRVELEDEDTSVLSSNTCRRLRHSVSRHAHAVLGNDNDHPAGGLIRISRPACSTPHDVWFRPLRC